MLNKSGPIEITTVKYLIIFIKCPYLQNGPKGDGPACIIGPKQTII